MGRAMAEAGGGGVFLQEVSDKVHGPVLTVWSQDRELAQVGRGEDRLLEVTLGASNALWWSSAGGGQGCTEMHPDTTWVRVIRASEGHTTTTWRCYRSRPPSWPLMRCRAAHPLEKDFGASGIFRVVSGVAGGHTCERCGRVVRNGALRWNCRTCDSDVCLACAEEEAWAQATAPGAAVGNRRGSLSLLEDFVKLDAGGPKSKSEHSVSPPPAAMRGAAKRDTDPSSPLGRRDRSDSLQSVPFLGLKPLGQIQTDTLRRLRRLTMHGDAKGALRTLARARQLDVATEDLESVEASLQALKDQGDFYLLLPPSVAA